MDRYELSKHARHVLNERGIPESWVARVLASAERIEGRPDGTAHYLGPVAERDGRYLRVVLNPSLEPPKVVTAFLDRRLERRVT